MAINLSDKLTADHSENYIMSIRLRSGGLSFSAYSPSVSESFFYRDVEFDLKILIGGGVRESFIYPIYGGIILLSGIIVVCTELILEEIKSLKDDIKDKKEGC